MYRRWFVVVLALGLMLPAASAQEGEAGKLALVIANSKYPDAELSAWQAEDNAENLASELERNGFAVDRAENLTREDMQRALDRFYGRIKPGSAAIVFFSGYGIQTGRKTYLIPVDAQIKAEADVRRDGIGIETILSEMNARGATVKVAILDASRRNPFEPRFRNASQGLASVTIPKGTLVIFAAAPGKVVKDGDDDDEIFVEELLKEMGLGGPAKEVFGRTRTSVSHASHGEQVPWVSSSLADDLYFRARPTGKKKKKSKKNGGSYSREVERPPTPSPSYTSAPRPKAARPSGERSESAERPPATAPVNTPPPPSPTASAPRETEAERERQASAKAESERKRPEAAAEANKSAPPQSLPEFPWPPPAASSTYVLPDSLFQSRRTVGAVATAIISALERNGYVERSFFQTQPGGIALVTRLERIKSDGSSFADPGRWPPSKQNYASAGDLARFLYGLFFVDPGHYRVIVFVLQDLPFAQSSEKITGEAARQWLSTGANILPPELSERPFGNGHCTVLIYEFSSDGTTVRVIESRLTGKQHLEKAGVLSLLEKTD